jgi:XapX domain-containing protein
MKLYLMSLFVGVLIGAIYGFINVRSPAPPVIALVGLAGILIGEQTVPIVKHWISQQPVSLTLITEHLRSHSFARLPTQASARGRVACNKGNLE